MAELRKDSLSFLEALGQSAVDQRLLGVGQRDTGGLEYERLELGKFAV